MRNAQFLSVLLLTALALAWPSPARADDDEEGGEKSEQSDSANKVGPKDLGPCKADAAKACPGLKPGDGKFGKCMKEHKDEISDACKEMMDKVKGRMKDRMKEKIADKVGEACAEDTEKFCSGMKPGDSKWGPCIKDHKDGLSKDCKRAMGRVRRMDERRKKRSGDGDDDRKGGGDEGGKEGGKHGTMGGDE
jgi:hypothetical protein